MGKKGISLAQLFAVSVQSNPGVSSKGVDLFARLGVQSLRNYTRVPEFSKAGQLGSEARIGMGPLEEGGGAENDWFDSQDLNLTTRGICRGSISRLDPSQGPRSFLHISKS